MNPSYVPREQLQSGMSSMNVNKPKFFLQLIEASAPNGGASGGGQITHDTCVVDLTQALTYFDAKYAEECEERRQRRERSIAAGVDPKEAEANDPDPSLGDQYKDMFSFLTVTASGKMVVLGGAGTLNCYQITDAPPSYAGGPRKMKLELRISLGSRYCDIESRMITSCICLKRTIAMESSQTIQNIQNSVIQNSVSMDANHRTEAEIQNESKLQESAKRLNEKRVVGDFVVVGTNDGKLFGFPFSYVHMKPGSDDGLGGKVGPGGNGRFIFDHENAGSFDASPIEGEDDSEDGLEGPSPTDSDSGVYPPRKARKNKTGEGVEAVELIFPIQKNLSSLMENRFISVGRTKATGWLMGNRNDTYGWHPHLYSLKKFYEASSRAALQDKESGATWTTGNWTISGRVKCRNALLRKVAGTSGSTPDNTCYENRSGGATSSSADDNNGSGNSSSKYPPARPKTLGGGGEGRARQRDLRLSEPNDPERVTLRLRKARSRREVRQRREGVSYRTVE